MIDNSEPYVRAAEECGWHGVVHTDTVKTIDALSALFDDRPSARMT